MRNISISPELNTKTCRSCFSLQPLCGAFYYLQVLVHRLGLIPIFADPRMFDFKMPEDEESTEDNVVEFELKIKCTRNPNASKEATNPDDLYINHKGVIL